MVAWWAVEPGSNFPLECWPVTVCTRSSVYLSGVARYERAVRVSGMSIEIVERGPAVGALCGRLQSRSGIVDGALWARFGLRRVADRCRHYQRQWSYIRRSAASCSDARSCRQGLALTLNAIGVFPMTHPVECDVPVCVVCGLSRMRAQHGVHGVRTRMRNGV